MKTLKSLGTVLTIGAACMVAVVVVSRTEVSARALNNSPVGAWFGIARPCPASVTADSPEHDDFCRQVCGNCPSVPGALPPEVPMMPTILADGTILADDSIGINRYHTTAHGKWVSNPGPEVYQIPGRDRYDATFLWLQSTPPPAPAGSVAELIGQLGGTCCFSAAIRPRFVTYFDPAQPDRMIGFIQAYAFPLVDPAKGTVRTRAASAADTFSGNHLPEAGVDPLAPLPSCEPSNGCLGTYHFVIRRIPAR